MMQPDWMELSSYPDTKKYMPSQWAWEFLRRTDEYKADWTAFLLQVNELVGAAPLLQRYIEEFKACGGVAIAVENLLASCFAPFTNLDISDDEKKQRVKFFEEHHSQYRALLKIQSTSLYAASKWHLLNMLDPHFPLKSKVEFNTPCVSSETGSEREIRTAGERFLRESKSTLLNSPQLQAADEYWENQPFQLHMTIDMRIPIGVLKAHVLAELERRHTDAKKLNFKRIDTRLRADKYLLYLRILDAIDTDATKDEIGAVLFRGQFSDDQMAMRKQVNNAIKSAKEAKENYWQIAHLD